MAIFAIADTHLGLEVDKPMDIFGSQWQDHEKYLAENWKNTVQDNDTVVIPGDISWAMHLEEARADLSFLDQLPGRKILIRGNHDYWWSSIAKLEKFCAQENLTSLAFLRNNAFLIEPDTVICGTRGWILPDDPDFAEADEKVYRRELGRLELSLQCAVKLGGKECRLIVCLHYPPYNRERKHSAFTDILGAYHVEHCVYGHIHGELTDPARGIVIEGVRYSLVASDALGFKPLRL